MAVQIPFPLPSHGYAQNSKMRVNLDFLVNMFNQFNTGTATWDTVAIGIANNETGTLSFFNASNANYLTFQPGATSANLTFTWPITYPAGNGAFLKGTTAGVMSWSTVRDFTSAVTGNQAIYVDGSGVLQEVPVGTGNKVMVNSTPPSFFSLLGTTNQITITPSAGAFTFSTPQDIATTSIVNFGKVITPGGSATNPAFAPTVTSTNTGMWAASGTELDFSVAGTNKAALDNTGTLAVTGGFTGPTYRATTSFVLSTSTSRILTMLMNTSGGADYTITWPSAVGALNTVLTTDASGNLSWANPSGTGANTALSNLASVAINSSLLPGTDNLIDLGSSSYRWRQLFTKFGNFGASGTAGQITVYPVTASMGSLSFVANDNSGNFDVIIENSSHAASRTYLIPDAGTNASFVMTQGTQNIVGTTSFNDLRGTLGADIAAGNHKITGLAAATINGDALRYEQVIGVYALDSAVVHNTGTENVAGAKTFTTQLIGRGTATNDSAASGYIGEYIEAVQSTNTATGATGVWGDLASIALTAGDWNVSCEIICTTQVAANSIAFGISSTTGNSVTGLVFGNNAAVLVCSTVDWTSGSIPNYRVSLSGSATYYLKYLGNFPVTTPNVRGRISARRVR